MTDDTYEIAERMIDKIADELRELRALGLVTFDNEAKEIIDYAANWIKDWINQGQF